MIKVGTRGSPLATRQADGATSNLVQPYELVTIKSQGDIDQKTPINEMGGKHVFCSALEESLIKQEVDCCIHSAKDMATERTEVVVPRILNGTWCVGRILEHRRVGGRHHVHDVRYGRERRGVARRVANVLADDLELGVEVKGVMGKLEPTARAAPDQKDLLHGTLGHIHHRSNQFVKVREHREKGNKETSDLVEAGSGGQHP